VKSNPQAGRTPIQRNTFYEPIRVLGNEPAAEAAENSTRPKVLEANLATA